MGTLRERHGALQTQAELADGVGLFVEIEARGDLGGGGDRKADGKQDNRSERTVTLENLEMSEREPFILLS